MLVGLRSNVREAETQVAASISSTMWKVSELIYEGQRLITALARVEGDSIEVEALRLQFDLLWSRVKVVEMIDFKHRPLTTGALKGYRTWLDRYDPVLFAADAPTRAELQHMQVSLTPLVVATRKAWVREFNAVQFDALAEASKETQVRRTQHELLIVGLLVLIIGYLVAEIYFGSRAQARERALRALADAANKSKSDFIASVSHEIRTPLNGIVSMASHLADHPLNKEQQQCVSVIEASGGLLLDTINDVLDLSRIKAGKLVITNSVFDPFGCLRLAHDLHCKQATDKGLTINLMLPDGPLPKVEGDERRFRQVLHNLVSNAVKFTSAGHIRITARYGTNDVDGIAGSGTGLYVSVSDTGSGIPYDSQQRVFDPFEQVNETMTRDVGGTGLGLPICRSLCQAMGGSISLQSEPGLGARFDVFLPFDRVELTRPAYKGDADQSDIESVLKGRVMIVDDTHTNRFVLRKLLGGHALEIFEAESGMDALEQLATLDVDVVLMDIQMPGMTGLEATLHLREAAALAKTDPPPVVAVTANVMAQQVQSYKAAGMVEVLAKPVSKRALVSTLRAILRETGSDAPSSFGNGAQPPPERRSSTG